jgi:hypothetical protein
MVFADDSGVFWNTVDTYFSPKTIQRVRASFPEIDFLLTTWHISMEGKFQYNHRSSFPFELYGYLFNLINLIQPKALAPGASGFKYIGTSSWQNQLLFPVTRERFCHDIQTAFPEMAENIFQLDPGDRLMFTALCVTKRYGNSSEQNNCRFAYLNIISLPIPIVFPQSVHFEVQIS